MARVRMVLVTVSPLLAALVIDVLQPHLALDVIGDLPTRERLLEQLHALTPDLVLLGGAESDEVALQLLAVMPSVVFLAVAPNGQHACIFEMRPRRTALNDFSAAALVEALTERFNIPPSQG